jgi:hypothetical protein
MKRLVLFALTVGAMAVPAATATGASSAFVNCGKLKAAGKTWKVTAVKVKCSDAKAVVRKLAAKPLPATGHYSGRYLGMGCLGGKTKGRVTIDCGGSGGKIVVGVTVK